MDRQCRHRVRDVPLPRAIRGRRGSAADGAPVVVQSGDYYGQTVNLAARIAEYARPGEVLVTEPVRRATAGVQDAVRFVEIGAVELKGVSRPVELFSAMA